MAPITITDWRHCFPYADVRREQQTAIDFILNSFMDEGKRYVIAEVGTGGGKSAIGVTVARYLAEKGGTTYEPCDDGGPMANADDVETSGAYVLTTQKILQEQYVDDFGPTSGRNLLRSLTSASNYTCAFYRDQRCSDSRRLLKQMGKQLDGTDFQRCCKYTCPYVLDKQAFLEHAVGITNFSYFLAETMYAKQLQPRALLVIDEAHNIENELGKFVEVTFSERFAKTALSCKPPKNDDPATVIDWIKGPYKRAVVKQIAQIQKQLTERFAIDGDQGGAAELAELSKKHEMLDKHMCKVNRFIAVYGPDNWVMNLQRPDAGSRAGKRYEFKPVDVASFGFEHLYRFGSRVLMMSATIVDKDTFCRSIGLDVQQVAYLRLPSPFAVANRPVHYLPVGSMSMKNIDATLPKLVTTVKDLLELHANDKGIIHAVNYRIARHIVDALKSPRLLLHDSTNREETIERHKASTEPTVLISPSMMEGVDLADDASRFQIVCKVPFPYLGDRVTQLRKARDPTWYACQTARTVIQSLGRSIRNEADHATSYILDDDWERFYRTNRQMFPDEFSSALR